MRVHYFVYAVTLLLLLTFFAVSKADDDENKKSLDEAIEDSVKGFGGWFKSAADNVKEKSSFGFDTLKEWAGGMEERFVKAKDKVVEAGTKAKETIEQTGVTVKEEVESAASKVSNHAETAMESVKKLVS